MRESLRDIDRLNHIKERIGYVMSFLDGKTFEEMKVDVMCYHAVVHNIMIIGEAANLLTKDFRDNHSEVPWRDIVDMRNVLVHGYYTTSPLFIWETYTKDLPVLLQQVGAILKRLNQINEVE